MPNLWSKQAYAQGFYCECITLKGAINMFDRLEFFESVDEGVVEPSCKKSTKADYNRAGHSSKIRVEAAE